MKCCGSVKQDKNTIKGPVKKPRAVQMQHAQAKNKAQYSGVAPYRTRVRTAFGYTTVV